MGFNSAFKGLTSTLEEVGVQLHAPAALPPGNRPDTPGPVWTGAENLASTGIRFPDRPTCSQSLYRLSYPGPQKRILYCK